MSSPRRVDELVQEVEALPDPRARERARLFDDVSMAERTAAVYESALDRRARAAAEAG